MNVIDKVFGVSPQALSIRAQRFEMISANLANADTPGYKAMDIDFGQALAQAKSTQTSRRSMGMTHEKHMSLGGSAHELLYRVPSQASLDGNSVETEQEHAAFMDNAIRYQASLNFLEGRIKGLKLAIRGD